MALDYDRDDYLSNERTRKRFKGLLILLIPFILYGLLYLHPLEKNKLNSSSKTECGYFVKPFTSPDSSDGSNRNIRYITINFTEGKRDFVTTANLSKKLSDEYKQTKKILKNIKEGDKVCATYSLSYIEDFGSKVRAKNIPYLIKLSN